MISNPFSRVSVVALLSVAAALGGCAALEREQTADTEKLLVEAGFRRDERLDFTVLRPREIVARGHGAGRSYAYADPQGCRCVYVGDGKAYATFRELARSEAIARDMSVGEPNEASTNGPTWAAQDPGWGPTDAWDDPNPALTNF